MALWSAAVTCTNAPIANEEQDRLKSEFTRNTGGADPRYCEAQIVRIALIGRWSVC